MSSLQDPIGKYLPYVAIDLPNREWPSRRVTSPPVWCSTDLRDGNQALEQPMTVEQKTLFFRHLVKCGFKEIEIAFPSASSAEFDFVQTLIKDGEIPDDVWIQVMTPARPDLIIRTMEALAGANKAIVQFYAAGCPCFREVVYNKTEEELVDRVVQATDLLRQLADENRAKYGTKFRLCYALETFSQTEPDMALKICTAVKEAWGPGEDGPMIMCLPSTTEVAPTNHFADQIEYFCKNFKYRKDVVISLHTHNDRGTAVAASEVGLLAGADRVDGTLFGNGERSGNVDIVTLALNLFTQGIHPGLDFGNLQESIDIYTKCTQLPIHPRHPYSGSLVYTAFSGSHQDAIKKGLEKRALALANGVSPCRWDIPYLLLDPADIGRNYDALIRVNSQSGKGGIAFIIKERLGVDLPRPVQVEFYNVVQSLNEKRQKDMPTEEIIQLFRSYYYFGDSAAANARLILDTSSVSIATSPDSGSTSFRGTIVSDGKRHTIYGEGETEQIAFLSALEKPLGCYFGIRQGDERTPVSYGQTITTTFVHLGRRGPPGADAATWGVGLDREPSIARLRSVVSAVNKLLGSRHIHA
ncbi:hypothetical protein PHLCEN_2v2623 [Hermanssonia centrifuga]|uniref:2-isopropylmalate synthase n=1 Tax=Hermanssonia centrifuga TaxID=98765 RepID=A0A2R6RIP0_9APHY|nr:hypothetical protein PHLCEN_2v2623 [Hermanssonia centrifuga]